MYTEMFTTDTDTIIWRSAKLCLNSFLQLTSCQQVTNMIVRNYSVTDVIFLLIYQFSGGNAPLCDDAADVNDDGLQIGLVDSLYILNAAFAGGAPIPAPNSCGDDETDDDALGCTSTGCP